jgi:hypothetical protein
MILKLNGKKLIIKKTKSKLLFLNYTLMLKRLQAKLKNMFAIIRLGK